MGLIEKLLDCTIFALILGGLSSTGYCYNKTMEEVFRENPSAKIIHPGYHGDHIEVDKSQLNETQLERYNQGRNKSIAIFGVTIASVIGCAYYSNRRTKTK